METETTLSQVYSEGNITEQQKLGSEARKRSERAQLWVYESGIWALNWTTLGRSHKVTVHIHQNSRTSFYYGLLSLLCQ